VNNTVNIQFSVTNISHEVVYLVASEPGDISCFIRGMDMFGQMIGGEELRAEGCGLNASVPYRLVAQSYDISGVCPHQLSHNFHNIKKRNKSLSVVWGHVDCHMFGID
jgi:hypothetical protein